MSSTTIIDADYLESFGSMTLVSPHIRIVAFDEIIQPGDVHTLPRNQRKPLVHDQEQFPALLESSSAPRNTADDPKPLPLQQSNSDVLVYGRDRPPILVALPTEIRELIWEARMRDDGYFNKPPSGRISIRECVKKRDNPKRPRFLPILSFVSKATYDEIVAVFMRNSKFMIASIHDNVFFREFIASIPNGHLHVRELHFDFFECFPDYDKEGKRIPVNSDLELAVDCTGLATLRLTFKHWRLQDRWEWDAQNGQYLYTQKTVSELVKKYRLHRLIDCCKLRKIYWDGCRGYGVLAKISTILPRGWRLSSRRRSIAWRLSSHGVIEKGFREMFSIRLVKHNIKMKPGACSSAFGLRS